MRVKRSTSTLISATQVVPWLASAGELSYSPASPPDRDYFFQYSWIIPGILAEGTNKRLHYWFGDYRNDSQRVKRLFRFWNCARRGETFPLHVSNGSVEPLADVTVPIAAYRHTEIHPIGGTEHKLILMQHGSYFIGDLEGQPDIDRGEAVLYRGIQKAETYHLYRLSADLREQIMRVHARSLTDSVVSFNTAHCNLMRSETCYLNDRGFLFDAYCRDAGLDPKDPIIRSTLYSGYALEQRCAQWKFGPGFVKFRTPLANIRITTFVANESEVKVIDPNKLEVLEPTGCKVREVWCRG